MKQPAGIGDIFFCQKIARYFKHYGYTVYWPVLPSLTWIQDYIPVIEFPSLDDDFPGKGIIYEEGMGFHIGELQPNTSGPHNAFVNTANADLTHNDGKIMSSKYSMLGMDHSDWQKYFLFRRFEEKENELFYNILGLNDDSEYVFINNLYNTDVRDSKFLSAEQFDLPVVPLRIIDGFTIFDWCTVMERAKKIHTVNTAINYIIDGLETLFYDEYVIYAHDENNKSEIDYLFKKPHTMLCRS